MRARHAVISNLYVAASIGVVLACKQAPAPETPQAPQTPVRTAAAPVDMQAA